MAGRISSTQQAHGSGAHAAKASIDARLHEMQLGNGGTTAEREAISDALSKLNLIRSELEKGHGPQRVLVPTSPHQRTG